MIHLPRIARNLISSEFYRNIAGLFSGIFAARLIPALFALIIARLYAPEHFGEYVLYLTIASVLSIFVNGGYEGAVILARTDPQRKRIISFSLRNNLMINILVLAGIFAYLVFLKTDATRSVLFLLIPLYAFFFGGVQMVRNFLISHKSFRELAWLEITRALFTGILQALFFLFPDTGLFLGIVIAQAVTFLIFILRHKLGFRSWRWSLPELALARRYKRFPLYGMPSEFFNFLSQQLPVFLIKPFFGPLKLGLYSFPHRYLSVPVQITSVSVGNVYIEKARSLRDHPADLAEITFSLFRKQVWVALIPFTILALWGKPLFAFLFGNAWAYSGSLAQILSPWLLMVFISSPLSTILIIREKQKFSLIFNVFLLLVRASVLIAGGLLIKDLTLTIGLFSATGCLFFSALGMYALRLAHVRLGDVLLFSLKAVVLCVIPLILLRLWLGT
jgi:O-antigen/teichoic acid export membrane protein